MADHNDPNAVNSIFSDINVSATDLYDIFGFPSADGSGIDKVVIALIFAGVPRNRCARSRRAVPDTDRLRPEDHSAGSG
jgi:hypothetical protein